MSFIIVIYTTESRNENRININTKRKKKRDDHLFNCTFRLCIINCDQVIRQLTRYSSFPNKNDTRKYYVSGELKAQNELQLENNTG